METLFNVKLDWSVFLGGIIAIIFIVPDISIWAFIALVIALHQFLLVFYSVGYIIPIRYIAGALMCLQILVGPSFAYSGLDEFQYFKYKMQVPEFDYFSYAIPAVICFLVGLNFNSKVRGEVVDKKSIQQYIAENPNMPYVFIIAGFISSIVSSFFGSELGFVFVLLGGLKFIGAFMLITGGIKLKPAPLIVVFGSIILSSLGSAMFHDLVTWFIFILAILALRTKPTILVKISISIGFLLMIVVVQQLKSVYREKTQFQGKEGNLDVFGEVYEEESDKGGVFDKVSLAKSNVRINQGFIITYILTHVPDKEPYANGEELYKVSEAAFLPRIIAPNKLEAGDNKLLYKYTGIQLRKHTSMSLSAPGDGYVNFGRIGGCIFMIFFGYFFNFILLRFDKIGKEFPIAILFTPLVFYFPIRPDTALQTSLGHLVKSCFLLYMILIFWKHRFTLKRMNSGNVLKAS